MTRPLTIASSLAVALLVLAAPSTTLAQDPASPTPGAEPAVAEAAPSPAPAPTALTGDTETGRLLTYTCQGCHGIEGYKNVYPTYHVPRIGGQSALYLTNALAEYKRGTRKHPTMQAQAQSFSDQDIADIAAFLSELKP